MDHRHLAIDGIRRHPARPASSRRPRSPEENVAAIGIRVRKWITFHGIAINVPTEFSHFSADRPLWTIQLWRDKLICPRQNQDLDRPRRRSDRQLAVLNTQLSIHPMDFWRALFDRIGHLLEKGFDAAWRAGFRDGDRDPERSEAFTVGVVALGAKLAKADGRVTRDEITAFKQVFHVPKSEERNVGRLFNLARQSVAGYEHYAVEIAKLFEPRSPVLERLMACLFHIASADGECSDEEMAFLLSVANIFGFIDEEFDRLSLVYRQDLTDNPFEILGLDESASLADARAQYRKLVREHHPDQLDSLGLPGAGRSAHAQMAKINTVR